MAQKQELSQLQKELEKERCAVHCAQDEVVALRSALDSERSAVRALRRDISNQLKKIKEEEADKFATLVEQLKNRLSVEQEQALKSQKECVSKSITAEFQRIQQAREIEINRECARREGALKQQLKDALNKLSGLKKSVSSSQNSVPTVSSSALHSTTTSSTPNNIEIMALRAQNKQLEIRIQGLLDTERQNADKVRSQYEAHVAKENEMEKIARRESHIMLEKLKCRDRTIGLLEKELCKLKGRLEVSNRNCPDVEKPGEPPRLGIKKRITVKTNGVSSETLRLRSDQIKETNSNDKSDQLNSCETSTPTNKEATNEGSEEGKIKEDNEEKVNSEERNATVDGKDLTHSQQAVGLETLYQVVVAEHQELQRTHQALAAKLRAEQKTRTDLEAAMKNNRSENPINLALAAQIQELTERQAELVSENHELREQNDLLEFRLLEIDSIPSSLHFKTPSSPSRSPESRGDREVDDISDSGVLSLPTSEDISETDFHELAMEPSYRDIKSRLTHLCQTIENISDRSSVQQCLVILKHYESRLELTLANMSPDLTRTVIIPEMPCITSDASKSQSRIIATVLPFTDPSQTNGRQKDDMPIKKLLKDADCLQESGIFEDSSDPPECCSKWTQTDGNPDKLESIPGGDLSQEIRKLKQIRERIEEQGSNKRLLRTPSEEDQPPDLKELLFYRDRVETLENKVSIYESSGDEQIRRLNTRLEKEILLDAQVRHLKERCKCLESLNRRLEEENCELEEAENDTRLRCQKLEVKLSALGEKKSDLQVQLQQNLRTIANLKSCLAEEEKKRVEARQHGQQMEALVQCYEQRNFEIEEREMESRCRVQMLEGTLPTLIAFNSWKMANSQFLNNCTDSFSNMLQDNSSHHTTSSRKSNISSSCKPPTPCNTACSTSPKIDGLKQEIDTLKQTNCMLKDKVTDLEMKEAYYKQTIAKADELWSTMESDYKQQITECEETLKEKTNELKNVEDLVTNLSKEKARRSYLQDYICSLEFEIKDLKSKIADKAALKDEKEDEETKLCANVAKLSEELSHMKDVVAQLKKDILEKKRAIRNLENEIACLERDRKDDCKVVKAEVSGLNRQINSLNKELLENECTISELREEVQTLEIALTELRDKYLEEQDMKERLIIKMSMEIEKKEVEIMALKEQCSSNKLPKSAKQELEEAEQSEKLLKDKINNYDKRSKSHRKHKAKCQLTLRKLNEKIKAGLLLDENQFDSIISSSSGDDSASECVKCAPESLSQSSLMDTSETCSPDNISVDILYDNRSTNEVCEVPDSVSKSVSLLVGNADPTIRLVEYIECEGDPFVDNRSTEVVTPSKSIQERSRFNHEENCSESETVLTSDTTTDSLEPSQRLTSATKHSTVCGHFDN